MPKRPPRVQKHPHVNKYAKTGRVGTGESRYAKKIRTGTSRPLVSGASVSKNPSWGELENKALKVRREKRKAVTNIALQILYELKVRNLTDVQKKTLIDFLMMNSEGFEVPVEKDIRTQVTELITNWKSKGMI